MSQMGVISDRFTMSARCPLDFQERSNDAPRRMAETGPQGDICTAAKTSLFDHLVGGGEQRRRNVETESLGGFEIDD